MVLIKEASSLLILVNTSRMIQVTFSLQLMLMALTLLRLATHRQLSLHLAVRLGPRPCSTQLEANIIVLHLAMNDYCQSVTYRRNRSSRFPNPWKKKMWKITNMLLNFTSHQNFKSLPSLSSTTYRLINHPNLKVTISQLTRTFTILTQLSTND